MENGMGFMMKLNLTTNKHGRPQLTSWERTAPYWRLESLQSLPNLCLLEQKLKKAYQTNRFENFGVNKMQILSLQGLPFSDWIPIKHKHTLGFVPVSLFPVSVSV